MEGSDSLKQPHDVVVIKEKIDVSNDTSVAVDTHCLGNELKINGSLSIDDCIKKKRTGGWTYAFLLLANQGLATLAFFGVGVNLVLFLNRVVGQENAIAANNVSKWTGTVYLCSLVGAFLSDSYWGRYLTWAIFQLILVVGLFLLSLASWLFLIKPEGCGDGVKACMRTNSCSARLELGSYTFIW